MLFSDTLSRDNKKLFNTTCQLIGISAYWEMLSIFGGKMLRDAGSEAGGGTRSDPTRGWLLVALSVATSIDALAVGLSMAFIHVSILLPCVVIGLVAASFSAVGITFANRIRRRWGRVADVLGGCALIMVGIRIVISHEYGAM